MNTRSYLVLIVAMLIFSFASVQLAGSAWGYGLEGGIAKGDNTADTDDEKRVPAVRGNMQLTLYEQLHIRFGLGYTPLKADNDVYDAKLVQADVRLLFRPIQMNILSPYLYAGIGAAKDVGDSSTDIFPVVPFGFGFQTRFSPKFLIDLSAGYNLALSDEMDGIERPDNQTNRYTNKKQDGNFTVMLGVEFTKPYKNKREKDKPVTMREKNPVANPKVADTDKDGLNDIDETNEYRTDPLKMDTDSDGLTDGEEVMKYRTNPLQADSDNDGLNDGMEINQFKTDPLKADSDNDGLTDYSEIRTHLSNPLSIDSDGGGMNDGAEVKAGKNPLDSKDDEPKQTEPVVVPPKQDTSQKDTDGDGLTDIDEIQKYRTDINKRDTDGDGLYDGEEVNQYRTDPLMSDSDKDGLSDGLEINQYKTDPRKADTDGDSLNDYAELMTYRTDPLKIDSDGGGMNDGAEVKAGKNPLDSKDDEPKQTEPVVVPPKPDTSQKDTDGDGLTDIDEQQKYRTDINKRDTDGDGLYDGEEVYKYRTDPLMSDSDKDGLSDGLEINQYKTDPGKADTDGDGLNDYAELMTYRSDPLKVDTDGGGMIDGSEIQAKKNPLDSKDDLLDMTKGKKVVLEGIVFASGKATITPESAIILEKVYESLKAYPDVTVQILGHTDSVGNDEDNRSLSLRRAQAVKDWLTARGISASRIKVSGRGESEPIASNDTAAGRARNRRIEFLVEN